MYIEGNDKDHWAYLIEKRCFDLVCSALGLLVLSPIFLIIMVAIKFEDPKGYIFFSQMRVGKNGNVFKMYKFRSMKVDAEKELVKLKDKNEVKGAMFKMKNDPRVTTVGKFLRRNSLDELPQLVNVLIGDMSLVGPRPPLPNEVLKYSSREKKRLRVKPGCSGLWQVSGRNELSFDEMIELDFKYITQRSFGLDLMIVLKTIVQMIRPRGAY